MDSTPAPPQQSPHAAAPPDAQTHAERLREAADWNLVMGKLARAGEAARRAGHPATRLP